MSGIDLTVEICGMSGDGTIAAGGLLNEALSWTGLSVMAFDSYPAEIRGFGRCVTRARIGDREMLALSDRTHVLISLDDEQSVSRLSLLAPGATVLFDDKPPTPLPEGRSLAAHVEPGTSLIGVPMGDLATGAAGTARGRNITALGAFAALFGISPEPFVEVITRKFKPKGEKVLQGNLLSFDAGYSYTREKYGDRIIEAFKEAETDGYSERALSSGNVAISQGILDAGVRLYFGYPITPATPIMEYLAKTMPERGGRVVQMEDEISSIGAVLGSFFAGARAVTATSGPGFALMTELITHGVMAEIPAVVIDTQRAGPATGMPTKTEQSDLHAAVFGGPGDSARIVIAPTNISECYHYTLRSFQYAEKYQTPVILLSDFFLNNRVETVSPWSAGEEETADWNIYPGEESRGNYLRFQVTESGISPRAVPGMDGFTFSASGLEHTQEGLPDYDPENHMAMNEKRHRKLKNALQDLPEPEEFSENGGTLDVGVISWGSTFGSAREAVQRAWEKGQKVGALKVTSLYPYHAGTLKAFMEKCREVIIPELNYEGQLANLIGHLCPREPVRINWTTGQPLSPTVIQEKIEEFL
jgi:2-oxoglutarate ferredoxin oxidoreductase subunit alpha